MFEHGRLVRRSERSQTALAIYALLTRLTYMQRAYDAQLQTMSAALCGRNVQSTR